MVCSLFIMKNIYIPVWVPDDKVSERRNNRCWLETSEDAVRGAAVVPGGIVTAVLHMPVATIVATI